MQPSINMTQKERALRTNSNLLTMLSIFTDERLLSAVVDKEKARPIVTNSWLLLDAFEQQDVQGIQKQIDECPIDHPKGTDLQVIIVYPPKKTEKKGQ